MGKTALETLQVFLIVLGVLAALWGVYDMWGEGQQSSVGVKKLIGGIAFAVVSGITMQWAVNKVGAAEAKAGITAALNLPMINGFFSGMLYFWR